MNPWQDSDSPLPSLANDPPKFGSFLVPAQCSSCTITDLLLRLVFESSCCAHDNTTCLQLWMWRTWKFFKHRRCMSILSLSSFATSFTLGGTFASIVDRFRSRCNAPEISAWTSQVSTIADKHNKSAQLKAGGVELCRAKLKKEKLRKIKGHKVIKSQMWWRQAPMDSMLNMIKLFVQIRDTSRTFCSLWRRFTSSDAACNANKCQIAIQVLGNKCIGLLRLKPSPSSLQPLWFSVHAVHSAKYQLKHVLQSHTVIPRLPATPAWAAFPLLVLLAELDLAASPSTQKNQMFEPSHLASVFA